MVKLPQLGTSIEDFLKLSDQKNHQLARTQPYRLSIGDCATEKSFYIISDGHAVIVEPKKISSAIVQLFQFYYVTNVRYPPKLSKFFSFLEVFLFGINTVLTAASNSLLGNTLKGTEMFQKMCPTQAEHCCNC
ncbi:UNVERIFIED_CONTAM: hypothetical protein FKN15_011394 [Acipenser sinensis]